MKKLLPSLLILAACGAQNPDLRDPSEFDGRLTCGAENFQGLLGRPESVLASVDLPPATRVLRPGDIITLDFSPDRLTIDIDGNGRIASATCR